MKGSVRVGARIDAAGCVSAVAAMSHQGLDDGVVQCVLDRVRRMEFVAPSGGAATVIIPVTFVPDASRPPAAPLPSSPLPGPR
jgi:hypothetical protein